MMRYVLFAGTKSFQMPLVLKEFMAESSDFRNAKIPLKGGAGHIPVLGFGTLIPDPAVTISATRDALAAGFRHFDCAERYRNEREVGEALQAGLAADGIAREDIFVTTKLWNTNHRPERVAPAFDASLDRLGLDYLDLYLIHTPFAFQLGAEQDPRDQNGKVIYDSGVTPGLLDDSVITAIAVRIKKTPAQVLLAWTVQRGTALLTTPKSAVRARENFDIFALPEDAFNEINRIQTRQRLNDVVNTGSPGFIPRVQPA
jgi:diketogulonate reductase-like aldo/keto reductase